MLANKPYTVCPFDIFAKVAPWATELKERVTAVIDAYSELMSKEAEFDGIPKMADEDFIYSRFEDNVAGGLVYANWEVLKYFYMVMRMKMYKEFLGEWTFTEHDVEMYRYFAYTHFDQSGKCKNSLLEFHTKVDMDEPNVFGTLNDTWNKFEYCYTDDGSSYSAYNVTSCLKRKSTQIETMIDRSKCLSICKDYDTMFSFGTKKEDAFDYFTCKTPWPLVDNGLLEYNWKNIDVSTLQGKRLGCVTRWN